MIDFTVQEYAKGVPFFDAVINSCSSRTRPILITAFALVGGSSVILSDPIFQGMAISLLFGVLISTVLTLIVIPLGTLAAGEESCKNIAINMGLIAEDSNIDDRYNQVKNNTESGIKTKLNIFIDKTKTEKSQPSSENAKRWIASILNKGKSDKINSDTLLKHEDIN